MKMLPALKTWEVWIDADVVLTLRRGPDARFERIHVNPPEWIYLGQLPEHSRLNVRARAELVNVEIRVGSSREKVQLMAADELDVTIHDDHDGSSCPFTTQGSSILG